MRSSAGRGLHRVVLIGAALFWVAGIVAGCLAMWRFQSKPGEAATAPVQWPSSSRLARATDGPTLVVFAHPRCPCTRASIAELRQLLGTRARGPMKTYVLVLKPSEFADGWEKTEVWRAAQAIPGVTVLSDVDGAEAARLGAKTSGQVLLYDRGGKLVFHGGITALRGEAGDNAGYRALAAAAMGRPLEQSTTPVFGCAIGEPKPNPGNKL